MTKEKFSLFFHDGELVVTNHDGSPLSVEDIENNVRLMKDEVVDIQYTFSPHMDIFIMDGMNNMVLGMVNEKLAKRLNLYEKIGINNG